MSTASPTPDEQQVLDALRAFVRDAIQRGIDAGVIANEFGRLYFIHRDSPTESK